MSDIPEFSEARRALLERYLRGVLPQIGMTVGTIPEHTQESPASPASQDLGSPIVPIIPLQTKGSKRPFFYLHVHVEGGAFYCFNLVQQLGLDQPFYILEPFRFEGLPALPTLEAMAAAYIEALRTIQPEGPYFLGGFCGGGLIAFEVARQLRAAGQAVGFLLLIEAKDGPSPHRMRFRRSLGIIARVIGMPMMLNQNQLRNCYVWLERTAIYLLHVYDYLRIKYRRLENTLGLGTLEHSEHGRLGDKAGIAFPKPSSYGITNEHIGPRSEEWIGNFVWTISHYDTRQYPGKVTYFWASHTLEQELLRGSRVQEGQVAEAEELEVHVIPGDHLSIINEDIHDLADRLRICLSKAQETALIN
jgi:Thioesterase domain